MKVPTLLTITTVTASAALGFLAGCQTTQSTTQPNRFDQADTNHDGKLSRDEISDKVVTDIFTGRDKNKDGRLTKEEWVVPGDEAGNKVFRAADANHDGVVTLDEAKAYGRKHGMAKEVLKAADKNHDGYVDREEARAYYGSRE